MNLIELRRGRERKCDLEMMKRHLETGERVPKPKKEWMKNFCHLIKGIQVVQVSFEGHPVFASKKIEKSVEIPIPKVEGVVDASQATN